MTRILPFTPSFPLLSDTKQRLITAFPRASAQQDLQNSAEVVSYSWPLPGASAAKAKASPPKKIKPAVSSAQKKIALRRIFRHKTRSQTIKNQEERKYEPNNSARNAIAVPGAAQGNHRAGDGAAKESMTSYGTYGSYVGTKNKLAVIDREEFEKKSNTTVDTELSHRAVMRSKNIVGLTSNSTAILTTAAPGSKSDILSSTNEVSSRSSRHKSQSCLYVTDVQECYEYIKLMRDRKENNYFCLHSSLVGMFDHIFHDAVHKVNTAPKEIIFSHVSRHLSQDSTQLINVRGVPDVISEEGVQSRGLIKNQTESLFSVLTLSVIENDYIKGKNISDKFIIPDNTFKLFKSPAPNGTGRYFIAYHINKCHENKGFNAGILPVTIFDNFMILEDQANGLMLSGDTVNKFIDGISKVTGLKYYYNDNVNRPHTDLGVHENYLIKTQSLFINQNMTNKGFCTLDNINKDLTFLSPVKRVLQENSMIMPLYRNCFTLSDEKLVYVNEKGEVGEFRLSATGKNSSYYSLSPEPLDNLRHYSQAGFLHGENYTRKMLIDHLHEKGMNYLSFNNDTDFSDKYDGFYMDIERPDDGLPTLDDVTETEITTTDRGLLSSEDNGLSHFFSFHNNILRYYDRDGEYGELFFTPQHSGLLRLDYNLTAAQRIFLQTIKIVPGLYYNTSEITTRLENATFVNDPNMQLPEY